MTEYISREATLDVIREVSERYADESLAEFAYNVVINIPAADVQPVKRGRWIWKERHRNSYRVVKGIDKYGKEGDLQIHEEYKVKVNYCSVCGKQGHEAFLNFCPNCGAKMLEKPNLQLLKNAVDLIQKAKEIKVDGARMDGEQNYTL